MVRVQQAEETNYFAVGFLLNSNWAANFSQYQTDITGQHMVGKASNNGTVDLSNWKVPSDFSLAMLWTVLMGREQTNAMPAPVALLPPGHGSQFHERPKVKPATEISSDWQPGFSRYSEVVTNDEEGFVQTATVAATAWTNVAGAVFPQAILVAYNRVATNPSTDVKKLFQGEVRMEISGIQPLDGPIDLRIPFRSQVFDWRPKEDGRTETGCGYSITNGILAEDASKINFNPALDWAQSNSGLLKAGETAPDFSAKTLDGKTLKLSDLRGKYVLLVFWSTTCGPCIGEIPTLKKIYAALKNEERFAMVGLALDEDRAKLKALVKKTEIPWPQIQLPGEFHDAVARRYKIRGIPQLYFIGPNGSIYSNNSFEDEDYIKSFFPKKK